MIPYYVDMRDRAKTKEEHIEASKRLDHCLDHLYRYMTIRDLSLGLCLNN